MKRWEEYQHQAAGLLRELGFSAEVDAQPVSVGHAVSRPREFTPVFR
jgi:hypothetical protein